MATLSACKEDVRWYNKVTGKKFVISTKNIFVLKEVRNQCAHLELITRFRLKRSKGLNYLNDITVKANLSHGDINYLDVVRIFRVFGTVSDIKREILLFYLKMLGKRRKEIADKILAKMGRKKLKVWMNL